MTNEENTIKNQYSYRYPRPAVTCDCVIFGFDGNDLEILLIERKLEPFKGSWALPGGFMKMDETVEQCARRELKEETNIQHIYLEQFEVFSRTDRDPRGRVVTVAFIALVRPADYDVIGGDDAERATWFNADMLPPLAFDHHDIISKAKVRLSEILKLRPVAFKLVGDVFSVDELRKVYEAVNNTRYDRRNFQRKLVQTDLVEELADDFVQLPSASRTNASYSMPDEIDGSTPSRVSSKGRKPSKLFRLKSSRSSADPDNGSKSNIGRDIADSIKDLFNF